MEEWDKTYGMVYKTLIDGGLDAIMGGHIMLPEYARAINPALKDEDMMPATLSPEIMTTLLRGKLGFNGMVVTDASHMVGMTDRMTRREMLPASINAGCDMFLFFNDPDEDFNTMLDAYKSGVISEARMTEALTRILGLKAHLGLDPHDVGIDDNSIVLTARSGRAALKNRLQVLGVSLDQQKLDKIYEDFLKLADKKKDINVSIIVILDKVFPQCFF